MLFFNDVSGLLSIIIIKMYKVFVQNRLTEIRRLMKCTTWKLVDSNNNPADIVSRGAKPIDLLNNKF